MKQRDVEQRLVIDECREENRFRFKREGADDTGGDVIVDAVAAMAGDDVELFAKVEDVRGEREERDKKENEE